MSFDDGFMMGLMLGGDGSSGGGGGDEEDWQPPDDWLTVPEPESNEIYLLVETTPNNKTYYLDVGDPETGYRIYDGITIDWGDGTITYSPGSHAYANPGQYLVKCYVEEPALFLGSMYGTYPPVLLIAKFGSDISLYFDDNFTRSTFYNQYKLHYIKINNPDMTILPVQFALGCYALCRIDVASPIKILKARCFEQCYNLKKFDFSQTENIMNEALINTGFRKLDLPECVSIGGTAMRYIYTLDEINAPLCENVGDYAFQYDYALSKVTFAENCTFGTSCFQNCYNLYSRPDGSTN